MQVVGHKGKRVQAGFDGKLCQTLRRVASEEKVHVQYQYRLHWQDCAAVLSHCMLLFH